MRRSSAEVSSLSNKIPINLYSYVARSKRTSVRSVNGLIVIKLKRARRMDAVYNASVNQVVEQLKTDLKSGLSTQQA